MNKHILIIPSWYVNSYNSLNGIFFKEQAEALVKYGHKVGLIAIQEIDIRDVIKNKKVDFSKKEFTENGVMTYRVQYPAPPKFFATKRIINIVLFKKIFEGYVEKHGLPDIVHLHSFLDGKMALWVKEKYCIPYVMTEHFSGFSRNSISRRNLYFAKKIFKNSDYNMAVSSNLSILLKEKTGEEFSFLPNFINTDNFTIKSKKTNKSFEFINIAFLTKNKNQKMLIRSFAQAFKSSENVILTIVGSGPEQKKLKNIIQELGMENKITLYGRANRDEVKKLLQRSDLFVLSSKHETFGVVLIEAMACGLPVISTRCGGPESIIKSSQLGLLVNNKTDLSNALIYSRNNIENYDANHIRQYAINNFSEKAICEKLDEIYNKVLRISLHTSLKKL